MNTTTSNTPSSNNTVVSRTTRRNFLKSAAVAGAAFWIVPAHVLGLEGKTAPSNKLTMGILGVGDQGRHDMRQFLRFQDVRITTLCDVNQHNVAKARENIAQSYGSPDVKVITDFHELNADPSIDAVQMSLPEHWHSIPSVDAILHGKHIYYEKPMTMSFEESQCVREAVHRKGVVFQFGTQQRSDSKFRWACELALNGRLGKLQEIEVSVPGGRQKPIFPTQPVPNWVDWETWMGPAPTQPFHEAKLIRGNHEMMTNFALGMIACWGVHHMDIAQWGNGTQLTGPCSIEGKGEFPKSGGAFDTILHWDVRFEYDNTASVRFVDNGMENFTQGVKFKGEKGWVHVNRARILASQDAILRDPQNAVGTMPIKLPVSNDHTRDFIDAIKNNHRAICDIDVAMRSYTTCLLALIAVKLGRKLRWDPKSEQFINDAAANAMLRHRSFRGSWKLPSLDA